MTITYDSDIPEDFLPIIKPRIQKVSDLFPNWCLNVVVMYNSENPNGYTLSCHCDYAYRFVQIHLYDLFFKDIDWEHSLLHEIIHAYCAPHTTQIWSIVELLGPEDRLGEYIKHQLTQSEESIAQDLATFAKKLTNRSN